MIRHLRHLCDRCHRSFFPNSAAAILWSKPAHEFCGLQCSQDFAEELKQDASYGAVEAS